MSKAFSWYYSKNATSSSSFVCWWAKCQISNLQFQGRDCFQLDGSKSKMKTNTCSHHPLTCSYGLADYLQWHQWTPEEPGDHGGQDCTVQEEADGSLSQGAAGLCFTFVTLSSKNVLLSFKRNNEMTSWWSPYCCLSLFYLFCSSVSYHIYDSSSSVPIVLAGADQTGDSEKKWLCYPSRWGTSPGAAGHHSVWTQCPHPVQGKLWQLQMLALLCHSLSMLTRFEIKVKWLQCMLQL